MTNTITIITLEKIHNFVRDSKKPVTRGFINKQTGLPWGSVEIGLAYLIRKGDIEEFETSMKKYYQIKKNISSSDWVRLKLLEHDRQIKDLGDRVERGFDVLRQFVK